MLKFCENGSNIDYLYETSSVLRKATETEISGLTFSVRFRFLKTEQKFGIRTSLVASAGSIVSYPEYAVYRAYKTLA